MIEVHDATHGFWHHRSIVTHVKPHVGKQKIDRIQVNGGVDKILTDLIKIDRQQNS